MLVLNNKNHLIRSKEDAIHALGQYVHGDLEELVSAMLGDELENTKESLNNVSNELRSYEHSLEDSNRLIIDILDEARSKSSKFNGWVIKMIENAGVI